MTGIFPLCYRNCIILKSIPGFQQEHPLVFFWLVLPFVPICLAQSVHLFFEDLLTSGFGEKSLFILANVSGDREFPFWVNSTCLF